MTTSPSSGLAGGLEDAGETDRGKVGILEASVSGRLCISPEVLELVLSSLGGDEGCLLKDAKAEAGLHPV